MKLVMVLLNEHILRPQQESLKIKISYNFKNQIGKEELFH